MIQKIIDNYTITRPRAEHFFSPLLWINELKKKVTGSFELFWEITIEVVQWRSQQRADVEGYARARDTNSGDTVSSGSPLPKQVFPAVQKAVPCTVLSALKSNTVESSRLSNEGLQRYLV